MDFGSTVINLGIIILLVIVIAIVFIVQTWLNSEYGLLSKITGSGKEKSTTFLDEKEDGKKCEICYGEIDRDPIAVCTCGKIFHAACAEPTGSCPYCGAGYKDMTIREPERTRCPRCGAFLKGNVCECGAVIPYKDNTFTCKCGSLVDKSKPVCKKCGAVYEVTTMEVLREVPQEKK